MTDFFVLILHLKGSQRFLYLFIINNSLVGTKHFELKRRVLNTLGCHLSQGVRVVAPIHITTNLMIDKDTRIGSGHSALGNGTVRIRNNCDIGPNVLITTGYHQIGHLLEEQGMALFIRLP